MSDETTLDCRLLCACQVSAEIDHRTSKIVKNPCYYDPVGFESEPTVIVGGGDKIDACIVGTSADGVIVAFRGTLASGANWQSFLDWLQDFLAVEVQVDGLPGKVHSGFHTAVSRVWDRLLAEVKTQTRASGKPVLVTGHSKGSAMATLASLMLHNEGIDVEKVVTIASPNAGNKDFAKAYDETLQQTRYTGYLDIVPFVPPSKAEAKILHKLPDIGFLLRVFELASYTPVGNGVYLGKDGTPVISEAEQPAEYRAAIQADLETLVAEFQKDHGKALIADLADAHSMQCARGWSYMKGICGDTVCSSPKCASS